MDLLWEIELVRFCLWSYDTCLVIVVSLVRYSLSGDTDILDVVPKCLVYAVCHENIFFISLSLIALYILDNPLSSIRLQRCNSSSCFMCRARMFVSGVPT